MLRGSRGPYPYDQRKHLIPMALYVYGDDSGTQRSSSFSLVLGYIGSPKQWKSFRKEWEAALRTLKFPDGAKREFRSKDLFDRRRWQSSKNPYHGWSEKKAQRFLKSLLDIVDRHHILPIGAAVNVKNFFNYSIADRRSLTGAETLTRTNWARGKFTIKDKVAEHHGSPDHPYFMNFGIFLREAMGASKAAGNVPTHVYLDRQNDLEARAKSAFDEYKDGVRVGYPEVDNLKSLSYAESDEELGLQAADLYAYTWLRKLTSSIGGDELLIEAFAVLTKKKPSIRILGTKHFDAVLGALRLKRAAIIQEGRRRAAARGVKP
jgi:hypothetical protein